MKFHSPPPFRHGQDTKIGVLITNLGTPEAPTAQAVRPYLRQFLSDPRVVEIPRLLWWFILNGIIVPIRSGKSAKKYASIWQQEGSPLLAIAREQEQALALRMHEQYGDQVELVLGMRYGEPSLPAGLQALAAKGVTRLLVLPLYPQYSATTTASTFDAVASELMRWRWLPELRFVSHYHDFPAYIDAMAQHLAAYWQQHGRADKLVFSFHGLPERNLRLGDPYFCECHKTVRLLAAKLQLSSDQYVTTFQSRFGKAKWLTPYTDKTLEALAKEGVASVQVFCPGFSADCLETLEEIDEENRDIFLHAGGQHFAYIPALNAQPVHLDALQQLIEQQLQGWSMSPKTISEQQAAEQAYHQQLQNLDNS